MQPSATRIHSTDVPSFRPISLGDALPAPASTVERATWDLKAKHPADKRFEAAKDVAAFANHLGGTLLIGAQEKLGRVDCYVQLTEDEAKATQDLFSQEVTQRCRPKPLFDFVRIPHNGGFVLAINVWPSLAGPVGVRVNADKATEGWGGPAFVFPLRVGSDSTPDFIAPENLAMFMTPSVRRAAVMLGKIQLRAAVAVFVHNHRQASPDSKTLLFFGVNEEDNLVTFLEQNNNNVELVYPLDRVRTVFKDKNEWKVIFDPIFI